MFIRVQIAAPNPVDAVVYTTALTLIVFLLFRIPGVWQGVDFAHGKDKDNQMAGGAAAIILGLLTLTIQYTMGATHTWGGVNYADTFNFTMTVAGVGCLLLGTIFSIKAWMSSKDIDEVALKTNQLPTS